MKANSLLLREVVKTKVTQTAKPWVLGHFLTVSGQTIAQQDLVTVRLLSHVAHATPWTDTS